MAEATGVSGVVRVDRAVASRSRWRTAGPTAPRRAFTRDEPVGVPAPPRASRQTVMRRVEDGVLSGHPRSGLLGDDLPIDER